MSADTFLRHVVDIREAAFSPAQEIKSDIIILATFEARNELVSEN
jgi:hypothetical protein